MRFLSHTSIFKAALSAAIITGFAAPAQAQLSEAIVNEFSGRTVVPIDLYDGVPTDLGITPAISRLPGDAVIGLARLDKGRMIAIPYQEADDWTAMSSHLSQELRSLTPAAYLGAVPNIAMDGQDTDNKIDEIRLAAVDSGLPYVLIYGIFDDAHFASFGGKALRETGLSVPYGSPSWQRGDAKALLVDSYSGDVLGAVTTWAPDMPSLTAEVGQMIDSLSGTARQS